MDLGFFQSDGPDVGRAGKDAGEVDHGVDLRSADQGGAFEFSRAFDGEVFDGEGEVGEVGEQREVYVRGIDHDPGGERFVGGLEGGVDDLVLEEIGDGDHQDDEQSDEGSYADGCDLECFHFCMGYCVFFCGVEPILVGVESYGDLGRDGS